LSSSPGPAPNPAGTAAPYPGGRSAGGASLVIVGGGFGGLYTALALAARRQHPPLLLIEPNERFLFLPLLYELLSGELRSWEIAPRYDALLAGRGVAWLRDRVEAIDADAGSLRTAGGHCLSFSRLVVATGGRTDSFGIPGVIENALFFRSLQDVERLQHLVEALRQRRTSLQRLAVVGAGPSGVELACKLADLLAGCAVVELIEQGPTALPQARSFNREQAVAALQRRDVRLRTGVGVMAVATDRLELSDGSSLAVEATVWTAGLHLNPPPITPAPARDSRGRLLCNAELQLRHHPRIFAIGDVAALPGEPLPATAQVAFQQADCLAANLIGAEQGEPLAPFVFNDLGEMLSLGIGEASLTANGITLAGRAAFQLRRLAYLTRLPGAGHQLRVAAGWLADWGR
jgi:NADH:ubiquinone reductase (non-electrogenic)